jgi:hypothetical protein
MNLELEPSKKLKTYCCEKCAFVSVNKNDYRRHLSTRKHNANEEDEIIEPAVRQDPRKHICKKCEKEYQSKSGLWNHAKKCVDQPMLENALVTNAIANANEVVVLSKTDLFEFMKQNNEFKTMMVEQYNVMAEQHKMMVELANKPNVVNNTTNNTQNNHFNLHFFLNETCKDAITADEFVKSIKITFADLENIGNEGYVQGFTNVIMNQLKTLDITKRPLHCTDIKRETIYIKEEDAWNKDNEDKSKLKNIIETVAKKSRTNVPVWQRSHPEVLILDSTDYDMNHKIIRHTWGDGDTDKLQEKVVKNLAKEVHVDKTAVTVV